MADGKVTILVDVDGKQVKVLNDELDRVTKKSEQGSRSLKDFALGGAVFKLASKGVDLLTASLDTAIKRFDTLERFPRVMKSMGHSAEEVTKSTNKLANGIDGLPTTLDEVVGTAQRLTSITGDLGKSTDLTLALNNAFLASGSSSADASRGLQQYAQMLSAGKVDMQSWKTLQETMPYALQKTAEAFGFTGKRAQVDFYGALKEGRITFDQFSSKLIELSGGVGGFAELAKKNSEGISTSFGNLKNSIAKGVAGTIKAFDELSQATTGKTIAQNIDTLKVLINTSFKVINSGIHATIPIFKMLFNAISAGVPVFEALKPALLGVVAGIVAMKAINTTVAMVNGAIAAWNAYNAVMSASAARIALVEIVIKSGTAATKAETIARLAQIGAVKASTLVYGVMTGAISLSTAATIASTTAVTALKAALTALTGPVGWVVAGIGALIATGVALWQWLSKDSEETKKLKSQQEGLVESTKKLSASVAEGAENRQRNLSSIKDNSEAYKKLADEVVALSAKENKSAGDKRNLKEKIDTLNSSIQGLNLAYDKNSASLSHNAEQIKARIDAFSAEDTWKESQQQLLDIETKRSEIQAKLGEIAKQRTAWNEEANVSDSVRKEKLSELTEQENALKDSLTALQTEYDVTSQVQQAASEAMALASETGANRQIVAYENLTEQQRNTVDNMRGKFQELESATTNMFDTITQKSAISVEQMMANLEQNRQATEQWANNLQILANRGVDQGILEELRNMGPEGALQTQVFVNATDTELQALQEKFRANAETAKNAMGEVMDSAGVEVPEKVKNLVTNISSGLQAEILAADFSGLAEEIPNGIEKGVDAGADKAAQSSKRVAEKMKNLFKEDLGIHSPSRVFKGYGGNVTEGLSIGVDQGTSRVVSSMKKLQQQMLNIGKEIVSNSKGTSQNIVSAFSHMGPGMHSHGVNAMAGLANGIYAGAGSAIAAAQYVASIVTATIQRALDIHSPSRVMRDEVGRFIPQGIAVGIEEDSRFIEKSLNKLKDTMTVNMRPELALGVANRGLYTSHNGASAISNTNTTNNTYEALLHIEHFENQSQQDVRSLFEQLKFLAEEEKGRL